jgi:hypothetical protein
MITTPAKLDYSDLGTTVDGWTQIGPSFSTRIDAKQRNRYAVCECKCGRVRLLRINAFRRGDFGCRCRLTCHGLSNRPEYNVWGAMIGRCHNQNDSGFEHYGGRGIEVCKRWRESFVNFYQDMGPRPGSDLEIDRINNDGNYEPSNCRWATASQNGRNRRNTRRIAMPNGTVVSVPDLAEARGIDRWVLYGRLFKLKWPIEKALSEPVRPKRCLTKAG